MLAGHPLSRMEYERRTCHVPGRTSVIVASSTAPLRVLALSLLSLMIHAGTPFVERLFVVLNGPGAAQKDEFLKRLKALDVPLSVVTVPDHVGHSQSIDCALPWVYTEFYTLMHDDVFVLDSDWGRQAASILADSQVAAVYKPPLLNCGLETRRLPGGGCKLLLPHINTSFLTARKGVGSGWSGYHVEAPAFDIDSDRLLEFHRKAIILDVPDATEPVRQISADVGSLYYTDCLNSGLRFEELPSRGIEHLGSMSWCGAGGAAARLNGFRGFLPELETRIKQSRFGELYENVLQIPEAVEQ